MEDSAYWREVDRIHQEWRDYAATLEDEPDYVFVVVSDNRGEEQFRALCRADDTTALTELRPQVEAKGWRMDVVPATPAERTAYLIG